MLNIECDVTIIKVELSDGRIISTSLDCFPSLARATKEQLNNCQILGDGEGIHWPDLDEDLSVQGLLKSIQ